MSDPTVNLTVVNQANQSAVIYQGVPALLHVTLTNATGAPIILSSNQPSSNQSPSTLEIFMPQYFAAGDLPKIKIQQAGWSFSFNQADQSLMLVYSGPDQTPWNDGQSLNFMLQSVLTSAPAAAGQVQINPSNFSGNVPLQLEAPLNLVTPPQPGNAKLSDTLQWSLDNQGVVYVSQSGNPLSNTLFLNFKNIGGASLYSGKKRWSGAPQVTISLVYGTTSGALAPDSDKSAPGVGSAWNIQASVAVSEGNAWHVTNPSSTGDANHPTWILQPTATNVGIIGTGASANITFALSQIVSMTPVGHTQMVVQFHGFPKDENTMYDDMVVVLDINKLNPPPIFGLLNFSSTASNVIAATPDANLSFPLRWAMLQVDQVQLFWAGSKTPIKTVNYQSPSGTPPALGYDRATIQLAYSDILHALGTNTSDALIFTLFAYDGNSNLLNTMQFTVSVNGQWGVLSFVTTTSSVSVYDPHAAFTFGFNWQIFETASVTISWTAGSSDAQSVFSKTYPVAKLSTTDSTTVSVLYSDIAAAAGVQAPAKVTFQLQAVDKDGNALNTQSCDVALTNCFFADLRDGKSYPAIPVGGQLWMVQNLDWDSGDTHSFYYNNDSSKAATYGRLYTIAAANSAPAGWYLPTPDLWSYLISTFGNNFAAMMAGGGSGFNAQLGGSSPTPGAFAGMGADGDYWGPGICHGFEGNSFYDPGAWELFATLDGIPMMLMVVTGGGTPPYNQRYAMSVRYVRNL